MNTYTASNRPQLASWILAAGALVAILQFHLLPALLAGLLTYELVHILAPVVERRISGRSPRVVAVALLSGTVIALTAGAIIFAVGFFRSDAGSIPALATKMAEILEHARPSLPDWLLDLLPENGDALGDAVTHWLREHASELQLAGKEVARALAHILVGLIAGAMIALREATCATEMRPLSAALARRAHLLAESFRRVVFAQVRISAINTAFTAIYLVVALPLFGVHLPLTKTMIAITFVVGLVPVVGNLISNAIIVVISLAHSPHVAAASLVFLVVVHKLEYFLNARIVGSQISSKAWELLIAMLFLESIYGIAGVVAAPIYYAYLKMELRQEGMV